MDFSTSMPRHKHEKHTGCHCTQTCDKNNTTPPLSRRLAVDQPMIHSSFPADRLITCEVTRRQVLPFYASMNSSNLAGAAMAIPQMLMQTKTFRMVQPSSHTSQDHLIFLSAGVNAPVNASQLFLPARVNALVLQSPAPTCTD